MNEEFKVGDVVSLKSGSPDMTIEQYPCYDMGQIYTDRARCIWFENTKIYKDIFPIATLEKSDETEYD